MKAQHIAKHICEWLTNYCHQANSQGFVIGISGGIDSAVTSTLAAKTALPVLCLEMPIHQAATQDSRAKQHILTLQERFSNVTSSRVDLTSVFDHFCEQLPKINTH